MLRVVALIHEASTDATPVRDSEVEVRAKQLRWEVSRSVGAAGRTAPSRPGVYAIGEVVREEGLVVTVNWRYIGRATARLNRRLHDHRTIAEKNVALKDWLASNPVHLEVWYASTPTAGDAVRMEAHLIKTLNPDFN